MKKPILLGALVVLLALGGQAFAEIGTIDNVPAATLLIPYFAVDVSDEACADPTLGVTTLFSVNNASADSTIAHVTVWTDWSVPSLDFDILLTGYDVQTVNLRDIFCDGRLPQTGIGSGNSPVGAFSTGTPVFDETRNCNSTNMPGDSPFFADSFGSALINQLKTWHTGQPGSGTGDCAGSDQGDSIARGYITIDAARQCSLEFPTSAGYFGGPDPEAANSVASNDNILWGDWFLADPQENFSQGFATVNLEAAEDTADLADLGGQHTFYGRYTITNGDGPLFDRREPLPTTVAGRFVKDAAAGFDETTHFIWREGPPEFEAVTCGNTPGNAYPIGFTGNEGGGPVVVFDEMENPFVPEDIDGPSGPLDPPDPAINIPNETNALVVGNVAGDEFTPQLEDGGFGFGWVYYNLQSMTPMDPYGDTNAQAWLAIAIKALGRFSVGVPGLQLDTANDPIVDNPGL